MEYCRNYFYLLQVAFYTLCRSHEYTNIEWSWLDFDKKIITIPAEYMKKKREHLVPLTTQLERGFKMLPHDRTKLFVVGRNQTDESVRNRLSKIISKRDFPVSEDLYFQLHDIRSTGRTWMSEHQVDIEVAENCLGHLFGSATMVTYNRTSLLEKRRPVMQEWCDYVG